MTSERRNFGGLVLKAVMDPKFRKSLITCPEAVIKKLNFDVSMEEIDAFKKLRVEDWENITIGELNKRLDNIGTMAAVKGGSVWIELAESAEKEKD